MEPRVQPTRCVPRRVLGYCLPRASSRPDSPRRFSSAFLWGRLAGSNGRPAGAVPVRSGWILDLPGHEAGAASQPGENPVKPSVRGARHTWSESQSFPRVNQFAWESRFVRGVRPRAERCLWRGAQGGATGLLLSDEGSLLSGCGTPRRSRETLA
jgi:hypothetical protein